MKFNFPIILIVLFVLFIAYRWTEISRARELEFHYPLKNESSSSATKEIQLRETKDKKFLQKIFIFGGILIIWQGVWSPTSNYKYEVEQSKIQYEAYLSGYENAWDDQCYAIFSRLGGTGNLAFGRGITITYPQCLELKLKSSAIDAFNQEIGGYIRNSSSYEMGNLGRDHADTDALDKVFSLSPYWCYGINCVSESDFRVLGVR